ncbi:hypothetical protein KY495_19090 [Massilia sp. PAMC28688]|uniref:hypothetical protein n=1 Tax=Massilia sp. PAMC28688 TaxID=2861283 RepID=UPI001C63704A|nr:hypothetical protein [Massilia sp. PAMC28688]QYF96235.1 hypothetical protein KY495_19090 [Massilia sp. PAMC28688]
MTTTPPGSPLCPGRPASQPRRDERQRDIIDHAVAVQASWNTVAAIEYLKSNGVDPSLIERVLLEPARRRPAQHRRAMPA